MGVPIRKDEIYLTGIQSDQIDIVWYYVEPILARVMEHSDGEFTTENIREALLERRMQLWVGHEGSEVVHACITQIIKFPSGKHVAEVTHLAGSRVHEWVDEHLGVFEAWAKENDCSSVRVIGRKGWSKILSGYKPLYTTLTKDI